MKSFIILLIINIFVASDAAYKFPDGFLIGTASSAYQVEGAWNKSGKGMSNWDYMIHKNKIHVDGDSNAKIATDFYHRYPEDIENLQKIGLQHYRFSLSWPRILPTGYAEKVNMEGIHYYHKVLDELSKRGIIPIVTIYHWDHPQSLEDEFGGWLDEKMAYLFADYARVVFREFGSKIKYYVTLNEVNQYCNGLYNMLDGEPLQNVSTAGWGQYICVHNMLKAHALTYHIYDKEFRNKQRGQLGISISATYSYSSDVNNQEPADVAFAFNVGWIANPIYSKEGDYPEIMKERIAERSKLQSNETSRLPTFSQKWIDLLKGSADYFGLNHYTSDIVTPLPISKMSEWPNDQGLNHSFDPKWETTQSSWLKIHPEGFGHLLRRIKRQYGNPPVYILENGVSDGNGTDDKMRTNYLYSYMKEMLIAMHRDGCDVRAYTIWSFTDSFEWIYGYIPRFGLMQVDFNDKDLKRSMKNSVSWLKSVLSTRELIAPHNSSCYTSQC